MATNDSPNFEGILLIDKPQGITSHDVVDRVRRKLKMKKVGHAGTLDPNATGLLIILVGRATKVSQYLMSLDKEYQGEMKLGETTDSYDCEGEITATHDVPELSEDDIKKALSEFSGDQYQTPPMFSAKKVDGVPLYKLARKGKEIEREPRFIRINELTMVEMNLPLVHFYVSCSKGTYIRTLAHDIGQKLGCGAHLTDLRRMATDRFDIDDSVRLEDFEEMSVTEVRRCLIPVYRAVPSHVL
ncbi:tRNA pseudouridine(55) synthase TruB [Rubellicoccus peritrichatus]|uniref:tRNA pseudouridine synthase B n=1 Tax=Rubellicoccus peritrichatus TaxID=3080537 RepID=A0AAQ3QUB1_9BACT|nr:tRNA pseudouridine(55) synthase TruB [Puniceicoccus sp. CR14]WOO39467.1 tRNA pseudouridine(55) synthase TruB [Puniceicoccus sp. CR14]